MKQRSPFRALIGKVRAARDFPSPEVRRRLRVEGGLTQADVAKALGLDRASVSRYENGRRRPSGGAVRKYADLLDPLTVELAGRGRE